MMANPVSFQPGDDVKVVYLYKKPTINNMIGTVVTLVPDQADMVEVVVDRRLYGIHASNLVSIPLIINEAYRTIALRILSTGRQLASRKGRAFNQTLDIVSDMMQRNNVDDHIFSVLHLGITTLLTELYTLGLWIHPFGLCSWRDVAPYLQSNNDRMRYLATTLLKASFSFEIFILAEDGAATFDDLPGNDEALYTSPQVAPHVKLFLLQNGWTLGILSGDTLNTI